jgi:hypothetical protein
MEMFETHETRPSKEGTAAREREIIALRLDSPKRADPTRAPADQADAGHLPLFIHANEPRFL